MTDDTGSTKAIATATTEASKAVQSEAVQKIITVLANIGYPVEEAARLTGDFVGVFGDGMSALREVARSHQLALCSKWMARTEVLAEERGGATTVPRPKMLAAAADGMSDAVDDEIGEMWARLLAAEVTGQRVPTQLRESVSRMTRDDAVMLRCIGIVASARAVVGEVGAGLTVPALSDENLVALGVRDPSLTQWSLEDLGLLRGDFYLTSAGLGLIRIVYPAGLDDEARSFIVHARIT